MCIPAGPAARERTAKMTNVVKTNFLIRPPPQKKFFLFQTLSYNSHEILKKSLEFGGARVVIHALGKILLNEEKLPISELMEIVEAVKGSEVPLQVDPWKMVFHPFKDAVIGADKKLDKEEVEAVAFRKLWKIKPYPEWLLEVKKESGLERGGTIVLVPGEDRYSLRSELAKTLRLVLNTGEVDVYYSKISPEVEKGIIARDEDVLEALRKAFAILRHTEKTHAVYEETDSLNCECEVPELDSLEGLLKALEVFEKELIDVRIPREMCWILRRDLS